MWSLALPAGLFGTISVLRVWLLLKLLIPPGMCISVRTVCVEECMCVFVCGICAYDGIV